MSDIEKIKKLRNSTGAGFKDCNAALKESEGDLDKAAEILRIKGIAKASKKMTRDAKEGVVVVSGDETKTSINSPYENNINQSTNQGWEGWEKQGTDMPSTATYEWQYHWVATAQRSPQEP